MNRKQFIKSVGATCANWTWSWSFVNHVDRFVVFGEWKHHSDGSGSLILSETWSHRKSDGKKNAAYGQSVDHLQLVERSGYRLFTFRIYEADERTDEGVNGPSRIESFDRELIQKTLRRENGIWYADEYIADFQSPEEIQAPDTFIEGASKTITVNAYERNRGARQACIDAHGAVCAVCGFDFEAKYGATVKGLIHVHHLVPMSAQREQYALDPQKDLRPVCPNCHAVIHYGNKLLSIDEVRELVRRSSDAR